MNVITGKITDMIKDGILEPMNVQEQAIKSAIEGASMILRIDDVVIAAKAPPTPPPGGDYGNMLPY